MVYIILYFFWWLLLSIIFLFCSITLVLSLFTGRDDRIVLSRLHTFDYMVAPVRLPLYALRFQCISHCRNLLRDSQNLFIFLVVGRRRRRCRRWTSDTQRSISHVWIMTIASSWYAITSPTECTFFYIIHEYPMNLFHNVSLHNLISLLVCSFFDSFYEKLLFN